MAQSSGVVPSLPIAQSLMRRPTITEINGYLQSLLPVRQGDVAFEYHTPRSGHFNPNSARPAHAILSITPTAGFYDALTRAAAAAWPSTRPAPLWAFLHRPWQLDRRRVPRGATIVSSHKAFDEVLTVGNNEALAAKLGMDVAASAIIKGYKGDPDRTIAIVGPMNTPMARRMLRSQLETEFGSFEGYFGFDEEGTDEPSRREDQSISCVAIMNAFHPEEVDQVAELAVGMGLIPSMDDCRGVLYLTGAVREPGLEAALKKGMAVVCVGHRTCEEWGIRHLASVFRERWPGLQVQEILEAEEPRAVKPKSSARPAPQTTTENLVENEIDSIN
ncbi:GTP cyclohydrolase 1 type 2/Nif3 [Apiospora arundinis]